MQIPAKPKFSSPNTKIVFFHLVIIFAVFQKSLVCELILNSFAHDTPTGSSAFQVHLTEVFLLVGKLQASSPTEEYSMRVFQRWKTNQETLKQVAHSNCMRKSRSSVINVSAFMPLGQRMNTMTSSPLNEVLQNLFTFSVYLMGNFGDDQRECMSWRYFSKQILNCH